MQKFLEKNSVWLSTVMGLGVIVFLILRWNDITMLQRIVGLYFCAISLHEWEEMKFPGGFIDMVLSGIGFELKNPAVAKLALFAVEMFIAFVPLFFPALIWMSVAPIILGVVETIAHLAATRMNKSKKFYSPGLITAVFVMLPISVYGLWYVVSQQLMVPGINWLWSVLYLFVPVLFGQRAIVTSNGMKYSDFLNNAKNSLFGKR